MLLSMPLIMPILSHILCFVGQVSLNGYYKICEHYMNNIRPILTPPRAGMETRPYNTNHDKQNL